MSKIKKSNASPTAVGKRLYGYFKKLNSSRELCVIPLLDFIYSIDEDHDAWSYDFDPYKYKEDDSTIEELIKGDMDLHAYCLIALEHVRMFRCTLPMEFSKAIYSNGDWSSALLYVSGIHDLIYYRDNKPSIKW